MPDRIFKDLDVVSVYGAFYLIMVPLCTFMIVFDELMREKCDNLRLGMQVLGTMDNAYWISWIVTGVIVNAIMTAEMIVAGKWYGFPVFVKTPAYVYFIVNFMVSLGYLTMGMMLSTLASNMNQAFTITFCVILLSMVMNILFAEPTVIKKVFFNLDVPDWVNIVNKLFYLVPGFQFSKLFMDITTITCYHFDSEHVTWVKSTKDFEYEDMFQRKVG